MLIDVIVPTFNRAKDVEKFVDMISRQTYEKFCVYILDDHSSEDIASLVPVDDKRFHFIRVPQNMGQAYLRNIGIQTGKGEIVVSLDDDAWFLEPNALEEVVKYFQKYADMGCLMFDVKSPLEDYVSARRNLKDADIIGSHIACGCAYQRRALLETGGFTGFFHSMAEETDISLKLIGKGYLLRFAEKIKVFHNYDPSNRSDTWYFRVRYNTCRNDLMIVILRYPSKYIFKYFFGKSLGHLRFAITNGRRPLKTIFVTIRAILAAAFKIPYLTKLRIPLTNEQFNNWLTIRW